GEWVLKGINFKVNPGDTVAFVGATGSGKTTILSLIVRNYEIQKGQILIDGIDIRKIKRSSLRKHIGQMLQDVFLFSGSIAENITLRDDEITLDQVIDSSNYVGANTFIDRLPDKYDHMVLERGNNFSSGQRQLISFARALVYKPSLMILDEATANIDSETEELIQQSLEKMMNISTMLIVAHRLSTIQHSDKILVMQKGEIKEEGSHQELLKLKGLYFNLYKLQYDEKETIT
ncbi:MAG: ABC transporter ATP-binding protein, partial [Tenericutes bacterium HGW-Tenericutes-3]